MISPDRGERRRLRVTVEGIVQGVGFRPFVYTLATGLGLAGWVRNHPRGVDIEIEGSAESATEFLRRLRVDPPPLALVVDVRDVDIPLTGEDGFAILASDAGGGSTTIVPPDIATCPDCLRELFDPSDRRFGYPFINCTNCGPRFTIVEDIPYDRERTTMRVFPMCGECRREYDDPSDRRFHAQPNACWTCGPRLTLVDEAGSPLACEDPVREAARLLREARIVAVKGLGGFHLATPATSPGAVDRLRARKMREEKPFAVMARNLDDARRFAAISPEEERILSSPRRPIVLLSRRDGSPLAGSVAPRNPFVGIMLPYTPLHHLLLAYAGAPLVMTSGNIAEEPICRDNDEAVRRLRGIADAFLLHNRDIRSRADDSVVRSVVGVERTVRRSRGYVPQPVPLVEPVPEVLAVGGMLKNTVCLTKGRYAFLSQHIGDVENLETAEYLSDTVDHLCRLLEITPRLVVCDLHPNYLSTRYAREQSRLPVVAVQHHHAHAAAVVAERGLTGPVIGVSFDGTGYGADGAIWGGEFLLVGRDGCRRLGHLEYRPLPGGERAVREPWRMLLAYLSRVGAGDLAPFFREDEPWEKLLAAVEAGVGTFPTSSSGRLFDGVAALLGIRRRVAFEGQAAMELEAAVDRGSGSAAGAYPVSIAEAGGEPFAVELNPIWNALLEDLRRGTGPSLIATRFHNTVAGLIARGAEWARERTGVNDVVLSGGVFQNAYLLGECLKELPRKGFSVYAHRKVPTNDGGISLGQALIGAHRAAGQTR